MILKTKRLILRKPEIKDAKDIVEGINNLEITKWLLVVPYPYKLKDAKWYVNHVKEKYKKKPKEDYYFQIELKSEKKTIGCVGIHHIDKRQKTATIGYWLSQKYWRQGIVSEALKEVLKFAFNKLKLRRLEAEVFKGNIKSAGLLMKQGFKYEGTKRQSNICKATGEICDAEIYGLLKQDYII